MMVFLFPASTFFDTHVLLLSHKSDSMDGLQPKSDGLLPKFHDLFVRCLEVVTSATLVVTGALLVVTRSYLFRFKFQFLVASLLLLVRHLLLVAMHLLLVPGIWPRKGAMPRRGSMNCLPWPRPENDKRWSKAMAFTVLSCISFLDSFP